jgi:hypothetical protein
MATTGSGKPPKGDEMKLFISHNGVAHFVADLEGSSKFDLTDSWDRSLVCDGIAEMVTHLQGKQTISDVLTAGLGKVSREKSKGRKTR